MGIDFENGNSFFEIPAKNTHIRNCCYSSIEKKNYFVKPKVRNNFL